MPLFVCDRCGCVDNTACGGTYWTKEHNEKYFDNVRNGEALCAECTPHDGGGVWHNRFPQEAWDGITEVLNRKSNQMN
jgi:hypothetical protein